MRKFTRIACLLALAFASFSCQKKSTQTWEDVKTAGRYIHKGFNSLLGKDFESRLIASNEDFTGPLGVDFLPLNDRDLRRHFSDDAIPQPKKFPGEKGSNLPGMDKFYDPPSALSALFRHLHFETDDHILKEKEDLEAISKIASYLKKNTNVYLVIEGHCDERAPADYNMALGMRRSQHIRVLLAKHGINPNRLYTVSCGKERPIALGHAPEDFYKNRRAQFKLFQK